MVILFKGKGILVPFFVVLSLFLVIGLVHLLESTFGLSIKGHHWSVLFGPWSLISGLLIWFVSRDFYKNKHGEKVAIDLDNRFFFIKMTWVGKMLTFVGMTLTVFACFYLIIE